MNRRNVFTCLCMFVLFVVNMFFVACKNHSTTSVADGDSIIINNVEPDTVALRKLQGIWLNAETQMVAFKVKGDSIFYPDTANLPVRVSVVEDSLWLCGEEIRKYKILKQGENVFEFYSSTGEEVTLHKSDNPEDSLLFSLVHVKPVIYTTVTKRDTVVNHDGTRYHCYVFVNPSRNKVYKTSYNEEGMKVENFYYDNLIHISVYQGRSAILSRDFTKRDFSGLIPDHFLQEATLSDMHFRNVDDDGFHFDAKICVPDDALCYMVQVLVKKDGAYELILMDY